MVVVVAAAAGDALAAAAVARAAAVALEMADSLGPEASASADFCNSAFTPYVWR